MPGGRLRRVISRTYSPRLPPRRRAFPRALPSSSVKRVRARAIARNGARLLSSSFPADANSIQPQTFCANPHRSKNCMTHGAFIGATCNVPIPSGGIRSLRVPCVRDSLARIILLRRAFTGASSRLHWRCVAPCLAPRSAFIGGPPSLAALLAISRREGGVFACAGSFAISEEACQVLAWRNARK